MPPKRFAPRKPDQPRAVALRRVPFLARSIELHLSNAGEPMPKVLSVIESCQLGFVRNTVAVRVDRDVQDWLTRVVVSFRRARARDGRNAGDQRKKNESDAQLH